MNEITINGIEYVPKVDEPNYDYVIVRGGRSGVFAGYLKDEVGRKVTLTACKRLWYWDGAASISQIAVEGVSKPDNCKFPVELPEIKIYDVIEVIPASTRCRESIQAVSVWSE